LKENGFMELHRAKLCQARERLSRVPSHDPSRRLEELMAAIKAGELQAYADLVRRVTPLLLQVARKRGIAASDLDDVVQETLLALYCSRANYDPSRPFLPWLVGITRHCAKDRWRRDMREDRRRLAYRAQNEAWLSEGADGGATGGLLADALGGFIARLPPAQRQVIELVAIGGMDLRVAAEVTGRSVGAVKVNLHRARETLHQRLEACGDATRPRRNRPASCLEAGNRR
jgi:RNA polymerase sigma-70 factor (ECF subfamily)